MPSLIVRFPIQRILVDNGLSMYSNSTERELYAREGAIFKMKNSSEFGSRIKLTRHELGITIERAAERCDVSESVWRQYEKGKRFPALNRFVERKKLSEKNMKHNNVIMRS